MTEHLKRFLEHNDDIVFGYLFGSYAKDRAGMHSDVDIALYFKVYTFDKYLQVVHELEKIVRKRVDLVVLNKTRNLYLLEDIIKNSIVLKDAPERDDFELKKWHALLDFKALNKRLESA